MANTNPTKQDVATIPPFTIPAAQKEALKEIAQANHRDLTKQLRHLIEKCIAESDAPEVAA